MIIGYGFRDEHINEIIFDAISNKKLRIHIVNPKPINEFNDELTMISKQIPGFDVSKIFNAIDGYYEATLAQIFTPGGKGMDTGAVNSDSIYWKHIKNNFFEGKYI